MRDKSTRLTFSLTRSRRLRVRVEKPGDAYEITLGGRSWIETDKGADERGLIITEAKRIMHSLHEQMKVV